MFEYIRKNAGSTVVWLMVIAIVLVFVFFGVGSSGGVGGVDAFTLNKQKVSLAEFALVMNNIQNKYTQEGVSIDKSMMPILKQQTLKTLVNRALVLDASDKWGLKVSNNLLQSTIIGNLPNKDSFYTVDGKFNMEAYEKFISPLSRVEYEKQMRNDVLSLKWASLLNNLTILADADIETRIHLSEDKLKLAYLFFPVRDYVSAVTYTADDLNNFYAKKENAELFRKPEEIKVDYIKVPYSRFVDEIEVTDDEIRNQFTKYLNSLKEEDEGYQFSHILLTFPKIDATDEDKDVVLKEAEVLYKRLETEKFEDLAKEFSKDSSTSDRGGHLGIYKDDLYPAEFKEVMGGLNVGEYSEPVKTMYGYHILKVTGNTARAELTIEDVKDVLIQEVKNDKVKYVARETVYDALEFLDRTPNMLQAAELIKAELESTDFFEISEIPSFLTQEKVDLFAMKKSSFNSLEKEDALYVFTINDKIDSFIPKKEDIPTELEKTYINFKSREIAYNEANDFIKKLNEKGMVAWGELVEPYNKSEAYVGTIDGFKRFQYTKNAKLANLDEMEMSYALLSLADKGNFTLNPIYNRGPSSGENGFFVLLVQDIEPIPATELETFKELFAKNFTSQKSTYLFDEWFNRSFEDSTFKLNKAIELN